MLKIIFRMELGIEIRSLEYIANQWLILFPGVDGLCGRGMFCNFLAYFALMLVVLLLGIWFGVQCELCCDD